MNVFYLLSALLAHSVYAVPTLPKPTTYNQPLDPQGWTPRPTEIPHLDLFRRDLSPRQLTSGQLIGYSVPDATCGYINGQLGAPFKCASYEFCGAVAPIGTSPGELGCCPTDGGDCSWLGTCYNYADFYSSSKCDHACQQDINIRLCTRTDLPFCYKYTVPDISATAYACDSTTGQDTVLTTLSGETEGRSFSPVYYTPTGTSSFPFLTSRSSTSSSSSNGTPSFTTVPPPNPRPIGAIIGGVVGGIVVISAAAVGIVFIIRQGRKKEDRAAAATTAAAQPEIMQLPDQANHNGALPHYPASPTSPTFLKYAPPQPQPPQYHHEMPVNS